MMYTSTNRDSVYIMHLIKPGTIGAEIGVWRGNTSTEFVKKKLEKLYLVDSYSVEPYKNNSEATFEEYIAKYSKPTGEKTEEGFQNYYNKVYNSVVQKFKNNSEVEICRMQSDEWFNNYSTITLDWIYIDGDHSYEGCLRDLNNAINLVKTGGLILGDDYYWPNSKWGKEGVTKAINKFLETYGLENSFFRHGETQFEIRV